MSSVEDILPLIELKGITENSRASAGSVLQGVSQSMANTTRTSHLSALDSCRDEGTAFTLKMVAIAAILFAGACGIAIPLVGRKRRFLGTDSNLFVAVKAFAAGVILATGFVHILPDATLSLTDPSLPEVPWHAFPFSGFIAMMAALVTLLIEFVGTQYYERKQEKESKIAQVDSVDVLESGTAPKVFGEEGGGGMPIVGIHAHAAQHRHSHPQDQEACSGNKRVHPHGHSHSLDIYDGNEESVMRHVVVSQVLELGIVSHSVIIGLSLGVSENACTITPLIAALSFHQFFEGFALGGCISQAQFNSVHASIMACFFAITTPLGIAVGTGISTIYDPESPNALIVEGIFDSVSAGILIYMALVDLIAADFLSKRLSCNTRLQVTSYVSLFLGAGLMSLLALWA
ncbi:unnamed protein product [Coffea canephora]|uniref:Uncharacterized protein n=1 Tax=Coffea canephora TaxID=49390 RepID=A0A068UII1_COFCA|nr:zinc transporter 4, chloroplastic-like [Coffea arabica]CDP08261.1 unnamed protein product [Coffea canephora]